MNRQNKTMPLRRTLMGLPDDIISIILSNFSYGEISDIRLVCHRFNRVCQRLLNQGIQMVERYHSTCLRSLKAQLPRRESERRVHPLSKHCDILSAVETRLSLLAMTYSKYIDLKMSCFIPGKVIDEAFRVLRLVMNSKEAPKIHELLQELRDISSMAMEHFDERIAPALKKKIGDSRNSLLASSGPPVQIPDIPKTSPNLQSSSIRHISKLQGQLRATVLNLNQIRRDMMSVKSQLQESRKVSEEQRRKLVHQQQVISELTSKVTVQNERITQQNHRIVLIEHRLLGMPGPTNYNYSTDPSGSQQKAKEDRDMPPSPQEEGEIEEESSGIDERQQSLEDDNLAFDLEHASSQSFSDINKVLKDVAFKTDTNASFTERTVSQDMLPDENDSLDGDLIVQEDSEGDFENLEEEIFAKKSDSEDEGGLKIVDDNAESGSSGGQKRKIKDGEDTNTQESPIKKIKRQKRGRGKGQRRK